MSKRYVSFVLGSGRYCVPVDQVMQILRPDGILRTPETPPFVAGAITLHGEVIPVIRLAARLGLGGEAAQVEASRARIVVTRVGSRTAGLAVDDVREIVEIDEMQIRPEHGEFPAAHADLIKGEAQRGQDLFLVLDLPRVLGAGRDLQGAAPV